MKLLEGVDFLADADELDRAPGHGLDGERRAAPGVAVELRHDHAVDAEPLVEFAGGVDRVLPRHGVGHEVNLVRFNLPLYAVQLVHHLVVDVEPALCVQDDHVAVLFFRFGKRALADFDGATGLLGVDGDVVLLSQREELLHGRGTDHVGGDEHGLAALAPDVISELGGRRRFAAALKADHHEDRRPALRGGDRMIDGTHEIDELVMDDLDDLLRGMDGADDVLADGPVGDAADELLDDLEVDVGRKEGHAHFPQAFLDVLLAQPPLAAELAEDVADGFRQGLEHRGSLSEFLRRRRQLQGLGACRSNHSTGS